MARSYIIKLTGCRSEGRDVSGEYDGGKTIAEAREEAADFDKRTIGGRITINRARVYSGTLIHVQDVRS